MKELTIEATPENVDRVIEFIDAAKKIRKIRNDVDIVFVTNEKDYVFDAFDVEAVHYLLKPVDERKLYEWGGRMSKGGVVPSND